MFELTLHGIPGTTMTLAEGDGVSSTKLDLPVSAGSVGTYRLMVSGRPPKLGEGSLPIDFVLRDPATEQTVTYRASFMGPPDRTGGR